MKTINSILALIVFLFSFSCKSPDFTNPDEVIKNYIELRHQNKNEECYNDYLSAKSKELATKDEYIKTNETTQKEMIYFDTKIISYPADFNYSSYRRFKIDVITVLKSDTSRLREYYTLINENGKWKVIWLQTLFSFADDKMDKANYSEARKIFEKIIEINPFSGNAYDDLACCYYKDGFISKQERENGIVKNAKYSITLEDDYDGHYNTMATYYNMIGNDDLEIEYLKRGLTYCLNKADKSLFYSNLGLAFLSKKRFDSSEYYLNKSIEINNKYTFAWYKYGELMQFQNKLVKAKTYYEIALKLEKMNNDLQGELYYEYAFCCYKTMNFELAKEYINKALDINPNSNIYKDLYSTIKQSTGK